MALTKGILLTFLLNNVKSIAIQSFLFFIMEKINFTGPTSISFFFDLSLTNQRKDSQGIFCGFLKFCRKFLFTQFLTV